jgi:hypothetical protein
LIIPPKNFRVGNGYIPEEREMISYSVLELTQPSAFSQVYDISAEGSPVARLSFKSAFGTLATGQFGSSEWTFKRAGFFRSRVTIRTAGAEADIATFFNDTWADGGSMEIGDGRKVFANTNFWMTSFTFTDGREELFSFKISGFVHLKITITVHPKARLMQEAPWLLLLGCYLIVMMQQDAAVAAA